MRREVILYQNGADYSEEYSASLSLVVGGDAMESLVSPDRLPTNVLLRDFEYDL